MEKKKFTADKIPVLLAFACVFGIVVGVMFIRDAKRDLAVASATPQILPLPVLLKQGAGKNAHVTATGLQVGQNYVTLSRRGVISNAFYLVTPTVLKSGQPNFCLLADLSANAKDAQFEIAARRQLTGLYQSAIPWGTLGTEATRLLRDGYPAVDLDHCAYLDIRPFHGEDVLAKGWKLVKWSSIGLVCCILLIVWIERRARQY